MDIKDLAGLSEPLKRLIEVTAEGLGAIAHPLLVKRNADAKAYEIRAIAQAVADSQKLLGTVKYDEGNVIVESSPNQELLPPPEADIEHRILMRVAYQQARKQSNIENVVQYAADDLKSEQQVGQEKPDIDWVTRFFNISEDISSEQMQLLWGKILAGEIKKPGSYSLRTLELLKNINQHEAELFVRVCQIAFENLDKVFVPNPDHGKYIEEKFRLSFTDILSLREIGLLVSNDLEFSLSPTPEDSENIFITGKTCVVVSRPQNTPKQHLACIVFTGIGRQLFQIIEQSPANPEYINRFAGFWRREGVEIKSGTIIEKQNDFIRTTTLQEVPE